MSMGYESCEVLTGYLLLLLWAGPCMLASHFSAMGLSVPSCAPFEQAPSSSTAAAQLCDCAASLSETPKCWLSMQDSWLEENLLEQTSRISSL